MVAVVGEVGCGKSTLLSALLGETEKVQGQVYMEVCSHVFRGSATILDHFAVNMMHFPPYFYVNLTATLILKLFISSFRAP